MNRKYFLIILIICVWTASAGAAQRKCFFASDCSKDEACVTPKGSADGVCQPRSGVVSEDGSGLGSQSIITEEGKCTFNTDCPDGGQCVKKPGALYGVCEGSGYTAGNIRAERDSVYKDKSCYFNQDCRVGEICVKPHGSFKGSCQEDTYATSSTDNKVKDAKDARALLQNFRTSDRQCLTDSDCALREVCLKQERTVFGVCRPPSSILPTTTGTATSPTTSGTSLFSDTDRLFNSAK